MGNSIVQKENHKSMVMALDKREFKGFQIFTIILPTQQMENSGQIFSLWVGKNSQDLAHHFYALQAEQFFDESEDPLEHSCIWKLYDSAGQRKRPYFLTFDTEIPHLNYIRHTNHSKLLAEMQKSQMEMEHYYFPTEFKKQQNPEAHDEKDKYLYERWEAAESNYSVIDKNFIQDCDSWEHWKQIFKASSDEYENKVRKHLENFDFMKYVTFTSDLERSGFSQQVLFYLRDQCPKKEIHYFQLEGNQKNGFYEVGQLQSFAEIGQITDVFIKLKAEIPEFQFFQTSNPFIYLAPIMNAFITPLCLKDSSQQNYLSNILINPRKNIFDFAYTLPLIDKDLHLDKTTNIFDFLLENKHQKFFQEQQLKKADLNQNQSEIQKEQILNELEENNENKINYGADYIGIRKMAKENPHQKVKEQLYTELISQAYVLKGHVKNFDKIFKPNCELLDFKYLEGILCNYTQNGVNYSKPYVKPYGEKVENYPFHLVMFQHKHFGDHFRRVAAMKNKKLKNELQEEWRENLMAQADFYKELTAQDDD